MSRTLICALGCLLLSSCVISAQASQAASNEEIKLLLGKIDQAMLQYERLINHQTSIFGYSNNVGVDRKLLEHWKSLKAEISKNPQKFNSSRGFDVVVTVDDASRNAVLVAKLALSEMLEQQRTGKGAASAAVLSTLMQDADACGSSFLKVSESAAELYTAYLNWQDAAPKKAIDPAVAPQTNHKKHSIAFGCVAPRPIVSSGNCLRSAVHVHGTAECSTRPAGSCKGLAAKEQKSRCLRG